MTLDWDDALVSCLCEFVFLYLTACRFVFVCWCKSVECENTWSIPLSAALCCKRADDDDVSSDDDDDDVDVDDVDDGDDDEQTSNSMYTQHTFHMYKLERTMIRETHAREKQRERERANE